MGCSGYGQERRRGGEEEVRRGGEESRRGEEQERMRGGGHRAHHVYLHYPLITSPLVLISY